MPNPLGTANACSMSGRLTRCSITWRMAGSSNGLVLWLRMKKPVAICSPLKLSTLMFLSRCYCGSRSNGAYSR